MPGKSTCPDQVTLQQLHQGVLTDPEASELRRHLQECSPCSDNWQRLSGDTQPDGDGTRPSSSRGKMRNILLDGATDADPKMQGPDTPSVRGGEPATEPGSEPAEKFFRPAEKPGELGRLGNYRILKLLSQGGMGMVYAAEDINLGRKVALKVIRPEQAATDLARQRFLQEARAVAAIEHDHIITIYQVDADQNVPYLAMQLLIGESLGERLARKGALPVGEILRIARQTAEGLSAAHAHGLIHRDIKPGNIFLERLPGKKETRVKILDFGLARQVASAQSGLTQAGLVIGTPGYMAPEQARNLPLDQRCDLFSLGCVIYQMATGQQPFNGDDPISLLVALTVDPVTPIIQKRPDLPVQLSDFVDRLLSKSPDDRPRNAEIVADALGKLELKLTKTALEQEPDIPRPIETNDSRPQPNSRAAAAPSSDLTPVSGIIPAIKWDETDKTSESTAPSAAGLQPVGSPAPSGKPPEKSLKILGAMQAPSGELQGKTEKPPAPATVEACPKCEGKVRNMPGRSWCLKCGWDSTAPEEEATDAAQQQPFSWKLPSWALLLLVGCVVIIAATALRGKIIPRGSWILLWWILLEGTCGIILYFCGHFWLLSIVLHEMRESELLKYLDPTYVWRYGFSHLPQTRGSLILGGWGATLCITAFIVFMNNNFAFKINRPDGYVAPSTPGTIEPPPPDDDDVDIPSAEESGEGAKKEDETLNVFDLRDRDRPEDAQLRTVECYVIGYTSSKVDENGQPIIDQLLLGTRSDDGQMTFAAAVPITPEYEKQAAQFRRQFLPVANPTIKLPSELSNAIIIESGQKPSVSVNYKEQDAARRLKNVVMQEINFGKKDPPRP